MLIFCGVHRTPQGVRRLPELRLVPDEGTALEAGGKGTLLPFATAHPLMLPEEFRHCPPGGSSEGPPEDSLPQGLGASFCGLARPPEEPLNGIAGIEYPARRAAQDA